jgi:ribosome-associated heat shock protein Hsp15
MTKPVSTEKVRIDKWLNAARVFHSRELAGEACDGGKVDVAGVAAKPHRLVGPGDRLRVTTSHGERIFVVKGTAEKRLSPPLARELYDELTPPPESRPNPLGNLPMPELPRRERGAGRPTKRDRREIDRWRE